MKNSIITDCQELQNTLLSDNGFDNLGDGIEDALLAIAGYCLYVRHAVKNAQVEEDAEMLRENDCIVGEEAEIKSEDAFYDDDDFDEDFDDELDDKLDDELDDDDDDFEDDEEDEMDDDDEEDASGGCEIRVIAPLSISVLGSYLKEGEGKVVSFEELIRQFGIEPEVVTQKRFLRPTHH